MTRPKRSSNRQGAAKSGSSTQKGSRGHAPKKMTAQGRGGTTRDSTRPVREKSEPTGSTSGSERQSTQTRTVRTGSGSAGSKTSGTARRYGSASPEKAGSSTARKAPPKVDKKKPLPELKRVQLDAPAPDTVFKDRDGERITFPDSNLRRMAAQILTDKNKAWRYRPFSFPLFTDKGNEQSFHFDFYIYDAEDSVIRLILVVPHESREVWDKVGRFKRQYPMYHYELWTPEKLAQLSGPRGRLGF